MRMMYFFSKIWPALLSRGSLRLLGLFLIFGGAALPAWGRVLVPEFDGTVPSYSWSKSTFGNVTYWEMDPPNILFLVDTSGSMTFDTNGDDPEDNYTYGDGGRPWDPGGWLGKQYYWGRNTDANNDDPTLDANYHPLLIYKGADARTSRPWRERSEDLIPNDSRLYILRNVMYRLFTEKADLLKGVNVGIATYNQDSGTDWADWYYDYQRGIRQRNPERITWKGSSSGGMKLRQKIVSAIDPNTEKARQILINFFDGTEEGGNPEIRADGGTPLASSIYRSGTSPLSAYRFFEKPPPVGINGGYDGICQANWLIVMTDGEDDAFWYRSTTNHATHTSDAVKKLYDDTKNRLTDKDGNTLHYPVRTMMIGFINPTANAKNRALAHELNRAADYGDDGELNNSAQAYYANNFVELFAAFEDILVTIKEMDGRKSPPKLRAGLPGLKGDVYVPEMFFWETKLWEGKLHKFILGYDGSVGDEPEWESSFRTGGNRVVLTANWYGTGGGYGGTNLVSFKDINWESVVNELGIRYTLSLGNSLIDKDDPDIKEQTQCFIRWYRGEDPSCTNWEQRKSPMADMDRSGIAIVTAPGSLWGDGKYLTFKKDHKDRPERLYIQSSEGMLHSFNIETGLEEWAFIPPQALRWARIAGLRAEQEGDQSSPSFWKWKWYGNYAAKADKALPREILGGPLVVEDVLVDSGSDEEYATVLLGSMGYGGHGLYALDITDVTKPRFLWAIENAAAVNPVAQQTSPSLPDKPGAGSATKEYPIQSLLHWEGGGSNTTPSATFRYCPTKTGTFNEENKSFISSEDASFSNIYFMERHMEEYQDLAFVLGNPFIGRTFLKAGNDEDSLEFLGFTGAGVRENLTSGSDSMGCAIYAFSMKDGSLYAAWGKGVDSKDLSLHVSHPYVGMEVDTMGMIYAPLSVKLTAQRAMEHFFVPDSNGNIHQVIFSEEGESLAQGDWKHQIPAKLLSRGKPLVIPHKMPVGKIREARWIFGGTKNVDTPSGQLENPRHYILGAKVSAYCDEDPCGDNCTEEPGRPIAMENLKVLDATISEDRVYIDNTLCGYEEGDDEEKFWGWQIPLIEADSESPQGEYVSAAPALSNLFGSLLVGTFEPYKETLGNNDNPCAEPEQDGMGRLYTLDAISGASDWSGEVPEGRKYLELPGVNITGIGAYDTFVEIDGEMRAVTRIVITFLATEDAQESLKVGELKTILENAGVADINTETDGMLSGAKPISEEKAKSLGLEGLGGSGGTGGTDPRPTVIPAFWKNN